MKELNLETISEIHGGNDGTACGGSVALLMIFPNLLTLGLTAALCLTGSSQQK